MAAPSSSSLTKRVLLASHWLKHGYSDEFIYLSTLSSYKFGTKSKQKSEHRNPPVICMITGSDQSPRVPHSRGSLCLGSPRAIVSKSTALNVMASERGASGGTENITHAWLQASFCSRHLTTCSVYTEMHGTRRKTLHNNRVAGWWELNNWPRKQRQKKARTVLELILIIQSNQSTANTATDL